MPARRASTSDMMCTCSVGNIMGLDVSGRVAWYPTGTGLTGVMRDESRPSSPALAVLLHLQCPA